MAFYLKTEEKKNVIDNLEKTLEWVIASANEISMPIQIIQDEVIVLTLTTSCIWLNLSHMNSERCQISDRAKTMIRKFVYDSKEKISPKNLQEILHTDLIVQDILTGEEIYLPYYNSDGIPETKKKIYKDLMISGGFCSLNDYIEKNKSDFTEYPNLLRCRYKLIESVGE